MNPVKTAVWISKFIGTLVVLLVVLPACLWFTGLYGVQLYQQHKVHVHERAVAACVEKHTVKPHDNETRADLAEAYALQQGVRDACATNPEHPDLMVAMVAPDGSVGDIPLSRSNEAAAKGGFRLLAQVCSDWERKHPIGTPVDRADKPNDDVILDPPTGCHGKLETAYRARETMGFTTFKSSDVWNQAATENCANGEGGAYCEQKFGGER